MKSWYYNYSQSDLNFIKILKEVQRTAVICDHLVLLYLYHAIWLVLLLSTVKQNQYVLTCDFIVFCTDF